MDKNNEKQNIRRRLGIIALVLVCALISGGVTWAWLSSQRSVVAIAPVHAPFSLLITAGNEEDAKFLDLSNIDVENTKGNYKDYVFAVSGAYIKQYKLQLAYTTNNQFTYEIYRAYGVENPPNNTAYEVDYYSKLEDDDFYYRIGESATAVAEMNTDARLTASKISMSKLNPHGTDDDNMTASMAAGNTQYNETYKGLSDSGADPYGTTTIDTYAMPLYEHSKNDIIAKNKNPDGSFTDYFILRVKWTARINDKETDIIYISAKAT